MNPRAEFHGNPRFGPTSNVAGTKGGAEQRGGPSNKLWGKWPSNTQGRIFIDGSVAPL